MIVSPTVFVLGAGISAPFGYPVGREMKDAICNGGYNRGAASFRTLERPLMARLIAEVAGRNNSLSVAENFLESFAASDLYSIDAWLEANDVDEEILQAGKAAIAAVILNAELLAVTDGCDASQDWFAWLWNSVWTTDLSDIVNTPVSFVTFNYDRLFEWKLERQLRNTYRLCPEHHEEALAAFKSRIVHPHGMLGKTHPPLNGTDTFGEISFLPIIKGRNDRAGRSAIQEMSSHVERVIKGISIVSEKPSDSSLVSESKRKIQQQDSRLVFLGFSFDSRNIVKLDLDLYAASRPLPIYDPQVPYRSMDSSTIIGSAKGVKRSERDLINEMFGGRIVLDSQELDAVEFCRANVRLRPKTDLNR